MPVEQGKRHGALTALTGARFFAAFAVVIHHFSEPLRLPSVFWPVQNLGYVAVTFFFVLSGFILTYTYAGRLHHLDNHEMKDFLRNRFARVYPMHFVTLLAVTPVSLIMLSHDRTFGWNGQIPVSDRAFAAGWLLNVTLLHAWVPKVEAHLFNLPSWSISCEALFYIAFPFFLLGIKRFATRPRALCLVGASAFLGQVLMGVVVHVLLTWVFKAKSGYAAEEAIMFRMPPVRLIDFFLGCAAGMWFVKGYWQPSVQAARTMAVLSALGLILVVKGGQEWGWIWPPLTWSVLYLPSSIVLVLTLANGPTFLSRVLNHDWIQKLGEASYSLYLIHGVLWIAIKYRDYPGGRLMAVSLVLTSVLLSLVAYDYIEMPCRKYLRCGRGRLGVS